MPLERKEKMLARQPKAYFRKWLCVTWCIQKCVFSSVCIYELVNSKCGEGKRYQWREARTERGQMWKKSLPTPSKSSSCTVKRTSHFWVWFLFPLRSWKRWAVGRGWPPLTGSASEKQEKGSGGVMVLLWVSISQVGYDGATTGLWVWTMLRVSVIERVFQWTQRMLFLSIQNSLKKKKVLKNTISKPHGRWQDSLSV